MKTLELAARAKNVSVKVRWGQTVCRFCLDTGFVVVQTRTDRWVQRVKGRPVERSGTFEETGPCPFCERGFYEEFGDPENQKKASPVLAPWHKNGFWAGREHVELVPEASLLEPFPREEALRRMRAFTASFEQRSEVLDTGVAIQGDAPKTDEVERGAA